MSSLLFHLPRLPIYDVSVIQQRLRALTEIGVLIVPRPCGYKHSVGGGLYFEKLAKTKIKYYIIIPILQKGGCRTPLVKVFIERAPRYLGRGS